MGLPLYSAQLFPRKYKNHFNAGLWYNKLCHTWDHQWKLGAQEKLQWINELIADVEDQGEKAGTGKPGGIGKISKTDKLKAGDIPQPGAIGCEKLLALRITRLKELVRASKGICLLFITETRFVTGLGLEHPVENGFLWHTTLGVPYIPGTAVKGLVRNWVEQWQDDDDQLNPEVISRVFGPKDQNKEHAVGSVIFFDALPVKPVLLEADIMTPHYGPYYSNPQDTSVAPGDWYGPTPIPFLTVAPGQEFIFAVAPRDKEHMGDLELVNEWLKEALVWVGVGAKTAIGYGRFKLLRMEAIKKPEVVDTEETVEEVASDPIHLDPIHKEMIEDGFCEPADTGTFLKAFDQKWKVRLMDEKVSVEEKQQIARWINRWYEEKSPEQRRKPNKKNKEKLKLVDKYLA